MKYNFFNTRFPAPFKKDYTRNFTKEITFSFPSETVLEFHHYEFSLVRRDTEALLHTNLFQTNQDTLQNSKKNELKEKMSNKSLLTFECIVCRFVFFFFSQQKCNLLPYVFFYFF
jgi:hypothetical protein